MSQLRFPDDLDADRFLRDYWQKRPLLLRQALPHFDCPLAAEELAGLACEAEIESRLVLENGDTPWEVRQGPFTEADFAALPPSHWTLLVQDVDKTVSEVAELLQFFRFIPDWRVDDVMMSYAADGGSVGPHFDEYDVFLVQADGKRQWQIHTHPVSEADCIPDGDLQILREFQPEQEWVLEPGDVLYLPPGVAHWGTAVGESLTCSVGFRAPSWQEMMIACTDQLIQERVPAGRYQDAGLRPQLDSGEILPRVLDAVTERIRSYLQPNTLELHRWFGRFITEGKPHLVIEPPDLPLSPLRFQQSLESRGTLCRHGHTRMAFSCESDGNVYLYVNGADYRLEAGHGSFVRALTRQRNLHFGYIAPWLSEPDCLDLLTRLFNLGHYHFPSDDHEH